jgi:pseudouridine-5'-phosphate glycosidase
VCSGAKSILDIGLTLEYLETRGVPVAGYQTKEFPAFYTRKSGFEADCRMDTPKEIAEAWKIKLELGIGGGMLVANPILEEYSMDHEYISNAIEDALAAARKRGIKGKEVTPFLLSEIKNITGGASLKANIELVLSNARLAARIAAEMCKG